MADVPFRVHEKALLEIRDLKEKNELQTVQITVLQQTLSGLDEDQNEELTIARRQLKDLKEELKRLSAALEEKDREAADWKREAFANVGGKAVTNSPEYQELAGRAAELGRAKQQAEAQLASLLAELDEARADTATANARHRDAAALVASLRRELRSEESAAAEARERALKAELAAALQQLSQARDYLAGQQQPGEAMGLPRSYDPPGLGRTTLEETTEQMARQAVELFSLRAEVADLRDQLALQAKGTEMTDQDYQAVIRQLSDSLQRAEVQLDTARDRVASLEAALNRSQAQPRAK